MLLTSVLGLVNEKNLHIFFKALMSFHPTFSNTIPRRLIKQNGQEITKYK